MKNLNKYLAVLIMIVLANFSNGSAQTESITIKNAGKVKILGSAILKINSDQGKIRTENTTDNLENAGTIELNGSANTFTAVTDDNCDVFTADNPALAYGNSAVARVPGLVSYNGTATNQDVQARFYTDLAMNGTGTKDIPTGVFVSGEYTAPGTGARTYTGDFTYDGDTAQTILGEDGSGPANGAYDNVVLQGNGVKTLATGTTADMTNLNVVAGTTASDNGVVINGNMNVAGAATQAADNTISIAANGSTPGVLTINGVGPSTLAGTVNVGQNGEFAMGTGALATLSGTLALGNFPDAKIGLAATSKLTISGSMTNANPAGGNATFDVASTVEYNGAAGQLVMGTTAANPYGNLNISAAGEKTVATGDSVVAAGNFALAAGNFNLGECVQDQFLWLTDATKTVTYGDGVVLSPFEVVGSFRRSINNNTSPLAFNNYATTVAITGPADVNWIELCVVPGDINYYTGYDASKDVKRSIKYKYDIDNPSTTNWSAEIAYGYKTSELETANNNDGFKNSLRFRETDGSTLDEKVATNVQPVRILGTDPFSSVKLAAIRETGRRVAPQSILAEVANANLLFLRGGPAEFISVAAGRWSNPATWDEGEQPGATDIVKIRNNVHIGFNRAGVDGNQPNENVAILAKGGPTYTNRSTIAAKITINDDFGGTADSDRATLIIGGDKANTSEIVGITRFATNDPLASLIPDSGTLVIKDATGKQFFADKAALDADATAMLTSNKIDYNHGVVVLGTAQLITRNNICVEGAFNVGGEVNVNEAD